MRRDSPVAVNLIRVQAASEDESQKLWFSLALLAGVLLAVGGFLAFRPYDAEHLMPVNETPTSETTYLRCKPAFAEVLVDEPTRTPSFEVFNGGGRFRVQSKDCRTSAAERVLGAAAVGATGLATAWYSMGLRRRRD